MTTRDSAVADLPGPAMSRTQRFLHTLGITLEVEPPVWTVVRSGRMAWQKWHRVAGLHGLAALVLVGSLGTAVTMVWLLIGMVRS
jgi:hypothetical protein